MLADAAMQAFDITVWREVDDARIDHVSHLVSAASEAASAALLAVDDLRRAMARRTVTAETITDDEVCALRDEAIASGDDGPRNIACGALHAIDAFQGFACRQACAAVLNAKRSGRPMTGQLSREACTMADLDAIRFEVARVDVMAIVAQEHFDRTVWCEVDDERVDFVAHLVAATMEAASAALLAVDDLRRAMASRSTVPSGQIWQDGVRP